MRLHLPGCSRAAAFPVSRDSAVDPEAPVDCGGPVGGLDRPVTRCRTYVLRWEGLENQAFAGAEQHRVEGALHLLLVEGNDRAAYLYDLTRPSRCQDHADGCLVDYLVSPWWDQFDDCRVRVDGDVSAAAVLDQGGHYEEADSECQERDDHDGAAAVHGGRLPGGRSLRSDRRVGSFGPRGCSAGRVLRSSLAP